MLTTYSGKRGKLLVAVYPHSNQLPPTEIWLIGNHMESYFRGGRVNLAGNHEDDIDFNFSIYNNEISPTGPQYDNIRDSLYKSKHNVPNWFRNETIDENQLEIQFP